MAKKSLASSMAAKLQTKKPEAEQQVTLRKSKSVQAPSRKGTKAIGGHFTPETARQLKILAAETDRTNQSLLTEALNLLFQNHGKPPIAK